MAVKQDLKMAASLIREDGWRANRHNSRDGYYLTGAIWAACLNTERFAAAKQAFARRVGRGEPEFWEMDPGRTEAEVLAALEAAAEAACDA